MESRKAIPIYPHYVVVNEQDEKLLVELRDKGLKVVEIFRVGMQYCKKLLGERGYVHDKRPVSKN